MAGKHVVGALMLFEVCARYAEALAALPRPVYGCCRSGGRSATLWALAALTVSTTDELIRVGTGAGFELSWPKEKMDMRREQLQDGNDDQHH